MPFGSKQLDDRIAKWTCNSVPKVSRGLATVAPRRKRGMEGFWFGDFGCGYGSWGRAVPTPDYGVILEFQRAWFLAV